MNVCPTNTFIPFNRNEDELEEKLLLEKIGNFHNQETRSIITKRNIRKERKSYCTDTRVVVPPRKIR